MITSGSLTVSQNQSGLKEWTARLRFSTPKPLQHLVGSSEPLHAYMVGVAFSWSGKAFASLFRPLESNVEVRGTGMLERQTLAAE